MRNAPIAMASLCGVVLLAGCAEWPRFAHLDGEADLVSTVDDPRLTILPSWTRVDETVPDANESTVQGRSPYPLQLQTTFDATGYLIRGTMDGLAWEADQSHEPIVNGDDEACEDVEGVPLVVDAEGGDYGGDLDFFLFTATEDGGLCATAQVTDTDEVLGVDLLLVHLDGCSVPSRLVMDPSQASQPLGYFMDTSRPVEWASPLSTGDQVAVLLTGFVHRDELGDWDWDWAEGASSSISYRLGVSIVPLVDGQPSLCPLLEEPS